MTCDFVEAKKGSLRGFVVPEMIKRRPVIVLAAPVYGRCLVACLSTTEPRPIRAWHYEITWSPPLPEPYGRDVVCWAAGDQLYTVSYGRLGLFFTGKDERGKRIYDKRYLSPEQMEGVKAAVSAALGLSS